MGAAKKAPPQERRAADCARAVCTGCACGVRWERARRGRGLARRGRRGRAARTGGADGRRARRGLYSVKAPAGGLGSEGVRCADFAFFLCDLHFLLDFWVKNIYISDKAGASSGNLLAGVSVCVSVKKLCRLGARVGGRARRAVQRSLEGWAMFREIVREWGDSTERSPYCLAREGLEWVVTWGLPADFVARGGVVRRSNRERGIRRFAALDEAEDFLLALWFGAEERFR